MRAECDATTRKVGERHVRRALLAARRSMGMAVMGLTMAIDDAPFEPCGWSGDVEDPEAWTCPSCLTEHVAYAVGGE